VGRSRKTVIGAALSSAVATGVDLAFFLVLIRVLSCHVTWAAFVSAALGGTTNFLINKYWVFRDGTPLRPETAARYALVSLANAFLVAGVVHLLAVVLGVHDLAAKALAAVVAFVAWSYPAQSWFVFPAGRRVDPTPSE